MNGLDYSLKLLLYAYNKVLAFSLDTSLSMCGITDSLGFLLIFHISKPGTTVKKKKIYKQEVGEA